MNQQLIKMLKAGIFAGAIAAVIEIIISFMMSRSFGMSIDSVQLVLGDTTVGLVTLAMTLVISTVIARRKQKI